MTEVAKPGEPIGWIAEVFLDRLDKAGFAKQRFAAGVGYTILITEAGAEVLSRLPLELHRR